MKVKFLFAAALAAMTLASCNKDEATTAPGANEKTNFSVTLPGAVSTYAVEDPQLAGQIKPYYNDVTVWLVDGGDNVLGYAWTDAEIKNGEKRFEEILEPSKVIVVVNKGRATLPMTGNLADFETALKTIVIEDQNMAANLAANDDKGNLAGQYLTVQNVTLMGECKKADFSVETPDDGHDLRKAAVILKSLVSRFEVGTVQGGTGLETLTVEAVYVNYFYFDYGMTNFQGFAEVDWPETKDPAETFTPPYMTDAGNAGVTSIENATKAYAYQVFAGAQVPHIIYKVGGKLEDGYKLSDGTTGTFTGKYITVKGFYAPVTGGSDALLTSIEAHKIYKMGLKDGGIVITPEQITDKPEKNKVDLIVDITVADWDVTEVTPEI